MPYWYSFARRAAGQSCLGTGLLLKKDLRRYGNVMDSRDEVKGMNNLCGAVEALLGEKAKVSGLFRKNLELIFISIVYRLLKLTNCERAWVSSGPTHYKLMHKDAD